MNIGMLIYKTLLNVYASYVTHLDLDISTNDNYVYSARVDMKSTTVYLVSEPNDFTYILTSVYCLWDND